MLLSERDPFSFLIFHGSLQIMQSYVSRSYWVMSAKNIAKRVQREWICFRYKAQSCQQLMGNLQAVRLHPTRAFKHSGLGCAGPSSLRTAIVYSYACAQR